MLLNRDDPSDTRTFYEIKVNSRTESEKTVELDLAYTYINMPDFDGADSGRMTLVNIGAVLNCINEEGSPSRAPFDVSNIKKWNSETVECGAEGSG